MDYCLCFGWIDRLPNKVDDEGDKKEFEKFGIIINELEITKQQKKTAVIQLHMIIPWQKIKA